MASLTAWVVASPATPSVPDMMRSVTVFHVDNASPPTENAVTPSMNTLPPVTMAMFLARTCALIWMSPVLFLISSVRSPPRLVRAPRTVMSGAAKGLRPVSMATVFGLNVLLTEMNGATPVDVCVMAPNWAVVELPLAGTILSPVIAELVDALTPLRNSPPLLAGMVMPNSLMNAGVLLMMVTDASPGAFKAPVPRSTSARMSITPACAQIGSM